MAAQNLPKTNSFFLAAGPLLVAILHPEQKTKEILKIYIKIEILKKSYGAHFIFIYMFRIFLVCCPRCKIAAGSGPAALFSKNLLKFFSCILTLVQTFMQNQISIHLFIFL